MEKEKRKIKAPQEYVIPKVCYPRIRKKQPKRKMLQRAQYQVIPSPLKFICIANFLALYGDIGLKAHQDTLLADTVNLNHFLDVRGVEILKERELHKINLIMEKKFQIKVPPWQNLVEGLLESESNELRGWGTRIKNFSLSYEEAQRALSSDKLVINGRNEKELIQITEEAEKKISKLFQKYPCLVFNSSKDRSSPRLKELCFNEQYLNELGYTLDSFATTVLQEGLPRMMPNNTSCVAKMMIDNYYSIGKDGIESPEIISDLEMKNGYLRRVKYKNFFFPLYRNKTYMVTAVVILLGKEKPVIKEGIEGTCEMNQTFLKKMIKKEKQMNNFTKTFYDTTLSLPYANSHKICKIRELNVVEDEEEKEEYIYKKEEDGLINKKEEL